MMTANHAQDGVVKVRKKSSMYQAELSPLIDARPSEIRGTSGRLSLRAVKKEFSRTKTSVPVLAINDVSLEVEPGTFVVLLGPSGCGKTTLLRSIAGLETPSEGSISVNGKIVYSAEGDIDLPPNERNLSMMFQSYALWPHMTVEENVMYPWISQKKGSRSQAREQARRILKIVDLEGLANEHPSTLSGGQQQRVALARTVVVGPPVVLFDEPLSNVDAQVREQLRLVLESMQARLGFTAIYVTHDQAEALALADMLVLMEDGKVAQAGPPAELYAKPASRYVASFIGRANLLNGKICALTPEEAVVSLDGGEEFRVVRVNTPIDNVLVVGARITLVSRPEDVGMSSVSRSSENALKLSVTNVVYLGSHVDVVGTVDSLGTSFRTMVPKLNAIPSVGDVIKVVLSPQDLWIVGS